MIIRELYLKNFGRFKNKRITLGPGINLIVGKNESGKSTTAQFIRAMLFGMKRGRGRASGKDNFHRYAPWNQGIPEGGMEFSCNERAFRLNRRFPEGEELFCLDDGEVLNVKEGDLDILLGGLSEGLYRNTVFAEVGDLYPGDDLSERLGTYLLNMESIREEQADVQAAVNYLKSLRKEAESEYRIQYRIRQERLDRLRIQMEEVQREAAAIKGKLQKADEEFRKETEVLADTPKFRTAPAGLWEAALFGLLAVVFVSMDHVIPGIIMAAAGFFLLIQSGWKNTRSSLDPGEQEPKKREMEYLIRKEHLEESYAEANRIYRNCESQYREALEAGEEEQKWQQRARECEMAASGIKKAAEALMSDWSGRLEQAASDILSGITAGKYYGLRIGTRMELTVTDGERVLDSDRLSYGTREQIWISVRLAAAMFLSEEAMPLVFDDAFLSWDDDRLAAVLCWLADCGRQILLFAGTGREQRILEKNGLKYDKIMLDE